MNKYERFRAFLITTTNKMRTFHVFSLMLSAFLLLTSCGTKKVLNANIVGYQSVRTRHAQPTPERPIPKSAEIAVVYTISETGEITAVVYNRTPNTMVIDQTKSFFNMLSSL